MKKRIFSGIQPSGVIHIGNYFGAIKQWVELQKESNEQIFCIVDLHAITVPQEPNELKKNILSTAALYIAAGIDPEKSSIFVQSSRPEHTELTWMLNCIAKMGQLSRMTQFKEKAKSAGSENAGVGLFDYPVLMAADILLYQTTHVPVGEDQKQHVELSRDLAEKFNSKYGQAFMLPEPVIKKSSARIMGLDDPTSKMSKSASSHYNYIAMTDDEDVIREKIKRAVTDSGNEIKSDSKKPAISNLINIMSETVGESVSKIEEEYSDKNYGQFKNDLAEALIEHLRPIQDKYQKILLNQEELLKILDSGSRKIAGVAEKTLKDVKNKMGLL